MADARVRFLLTAEDRTRRAFSSVRKAIGGLSSMAARAGGLIGGLAGIGGAAGLVTMGRQSILAADKIGHLQNRLGGTAKFWTSMQHAAALSGVTFETFTMAMQRMTRRIGEAALGTGEAKKQIAAFGLDARKLSDLPLEKQFFIIADKLAKIKNPGERAAAAMKLFDSEGVALVQMMSDGSAGIREMMKEALTLGLVLNNVDILNSQGFMGAVERMSGAFRGFVNDVVMPLLPAMTEGIHGFTDSVLANKDSWINWGMGVVSWLTGAFAAAQPFFSIMSSGFGMVRDGLVMLTQIGGAVWDVLREIFMGAGDVIGGVAAVIMQLIQGNFAGAAAINQSVTESAARRGGALSGALSNLQESVLNANPSRGSGLNLSGPVSAEAQAGQLGRLLGSNDEAVKLLAQLVELERKKELDAFNPLRDLAVAQ